MFILKKKGLIISKSIYLFFFLVVVYSCNINDLNFDNINIPNFTGKEAVPIGEVTYTIKELIDELKDPNLVTNVSKNQFITIIYRDTSIYNNYSDFITINQIVNSSNFNPGLSSPMSAVDVKLPFSQLFEFNFQSQDNKKIDSAFYSSGIAELLVQSQFNSALNYTVKIVDFTNSITGDTLVYSDNIVANGSSQASKNLTNFKVIFNRVNNLNVFHLIFEGELDVKAGESVDINDSLTITFTISNSIFSSLFGFFEVDLIKIQDQSIKLDFFKNIQPQGFVFNTPKINVIIQNTLGIPFGILLSGISTSNPVGDIVQLTGSIIDTVSIRAPLLDAVGGSLNSVIAISNDNSNLRDLLAISPDSIRIPILGKSNFRNKTGMISNFYTDSSFLKTIVEVEIPLDAKLDGFTRFFDFDISNINFDDADSIKFRIQTINDLPLSGTMTVDMLDSMGKVIYQVPSIIIFQSPKINNIDKTEKSFHNTSFIILDSMGVMTFAKAKKIRLTMMVDSYQSADGTFVKIFSDYQLIVKISAIANLNVNI